MSTGPQLTREGTTLGTIFYMSREQLLGEGLDARSDLYSLGVSLYEATTGQLPYFHDDQQRLIKLMLKTEPKPPRAYHAAIPANFSHAS